MRILAVTNQSPFPVNNGQRVRTSLFLEALKEYHEIDLVIYDYAGEEIPNWFHSTHLFTMKCKSRIDDMKALLSGKSIYCERFRNAHARERIDLLLNENQYDIILSLALPGMVNLPPDTEVPIWLDDHNMEYEIYQEYGRGANLLLKSIVNIESRRLKRWEMAMIDRAKMVTLCSTEDVEKLPLINQLKCSVVPNSCPDSTQKEPVLFNVSSPTIIYSGTMGWKPNVDACLYFLQEIWPFVKKAIPTVHFCILGKDPSDELLREVNRWKDVSCTGFVESTDLYLSTATLSVVPLRMGSGTRIKIIEAAQYGLPVVSTSKGAEGLHFTDCKEILIADEAVPFAQAVISLLQSRALWEKQSEAIKRRFDREYSREAVKEEVNQVLRIEKAGVA